MKSNKRIPGKKANLMARSVACYDSFCVEDNYDDGNRVGTFIALGVALVVLLGVALYSNATVIGTELLANPYFTVL